MASMKSSRSDIETVKSPAIVTPSSVGPVVSSMSLRKKVLIGLAALGMIGVAAGIGAGVGKSSSHVSSNSAASSSTTDSATSSATPAGYNTTYNGKDITCKVEHGKYVITNVPSWTACVDSLTGDVYDPELEITAHGLQVELPWDVSYSTSLTFDINQSQTCIRNFCLCVGPADKFRSVTCPAGEDEDPEYQN
eukprot:TRINITY_DN1198_c0_g1_i2.p1 TRINITY_DN1198_c0_g1~~TRINITY_DN1198_c0_g1_i2.p1  ORF type:complete len:193 (-),score=50.69 TRINITY_DN1198_c0_g1_i2:78-656(-)